MAMLETDISVSKSDLRGIGRAMLRAQRDLGMSHAGSIRFGAWAVASGCAAKTKMSKKYRKYRVHMTAAERREFGGRKRYIVTNDKTGKEFAVFASSVAELKRDPRVEIANRGLAKTVWRVLQHKHGSGRADADIGRRAAKHARKLARIEVSTDYWNPYIRLTNAADNAHAALRGGESALDGVVGRASRRMGHIIDGKMKNAFRGQGFAIK